MITGINHKNSQSIINRGNNTFRGISEPKDEVVIHREFISESHIIHGMKPYNPSLSTQVKGNKGIEKRADYIKD
ncbi:MAG: hypothetical protein ABRQ38_30880, partial [Candidatus Eremiobacterota bacterium]